MTLTKNEEFSRASFQVQIGETSESGYDSVGGTDDEESDESEEAPDYRGARNVDAVRASKFSRGRDGNSIASASS